MGKMTKTEFVESLKKLKDICDEYEMDCAVAEAKEKAEREKWAELRRTAAMNFAAAILSNPAWYKRFTGYDEAAKFDNAYYKKHVVDNAIFYADYLIGVLKEDEKY